MSAATEIAASLCHTSYSSEIVRAVETKQARIAVVSLLTATLAGATLGFLKYNFNPATIFLGDSGSLFIGFTLSGQALVGGW